MTVASPPLWIRAALAWIILANAFDMALTLVGVQANRIQEANPIMRLALQAGPMTAVALKVALVGSSVAALYWAYPRRPRFAAAGIGFLCAIMMGVMALHLSWIVP